MSRILTARRPRGQRGMVTAEFAAALPVLVFLSVLALGAVGAATTMLRCQDAAYAAARAAARGESAPRTETGLEVVVTPEGKLISATAASDVKVWGARFPAWRIRAHAVAMREADEW